MIVPRLNLAAELVQPAADPVPLVAGQVFPAAKSSANHVAGNVAGNQARYGDVQAGAWYVAKTGWEVRNHRGRLARRPLSGHEDTDEAQRH